MLHPGLGRARGVFLTSGSVRCPLLGGFCGNVGGLTLFPQHLGVGEASLELLEASHGVTGAGETAPEGRREARVSRRTQTS